MVGGGGGGGRSSAFGGFLSISDSKNSTAIFFLPQANYRQIQESGYHYVAINELVSITRIVRRLQRAGVNSESSTKCVGAARM